MQMNARNRDQSLCFTFADGVKNTNGLMKTILTGIKAVTTAHCDIHTPTLEQYFNVN